MNIYIFTETGRKIGLGHFTRCLALKQGFQEKYPNAVVKSIVSADKSIQAYVSAIDRDCIYMDWLHLGNKVSRIVADADLVIIDSYKAPLSFYECLYRISLQETCRIMVIDDYNRLPYRADIIVNPSLYGSDVKYKQKKGLKYLVGEKYVILRKAFQQSSKKYIRKYPKNLLIVLGGTQVANNVTILLSKIKGQFPDLDCHVVLPKVSKHEQGRLQRYAKKIYISLNDQEMYALMRRCDIAVSGGGQITYELARLGVPFFSILLARNQQLNIKGWKRKGFLNYSGRCNTPHMYQIVLSNIKKLFSYEQRQYFSLRGKKLIDGKGVNRIVSYIMAR